MTTAADWFTDEADFRQLCGDAQSASRGRQSQEFAAQMLRHAKEHGLTTNLTLRQLQYLCGMADWDVPRRLGQN